MGGGGGGVVRDCVRWLQLVIRDLHYVLPDGPDGPRTFPPKGDVCILGIFSLMWFPLYKMMPQLLHSLPLPFYHKSFYQNIILLFYKIRLYKIRIKLSLLLNNQYNGGLSYTFPSKVSCFLLDRNIIQISHFHDFTKFWEINIRVPKMSYFLLHSFWDIWQESHIIVLLR